MSLITLKDIVVQYKTMDRPAFQCASLEVNQGEIIAVVGHNGAGKSTMFKVLGGLDNKYQGTRVLGLASSEIGWCPQREIIDWSLTVGQNIALGYAFKKAVSRRQITADVNDVCQVLGLSKYQSRTAETLSGGELRRTQIARAIIGHPQFMLLDEPTTGLDPEGISIVFGYLQEQVARGATAVISTHETSRFSAYCTRVIAIHQGVIIADESAQDFMRRSPGSDDLWDSYTTLVDNLASGKNHA